MTLEALLSVVTAQPSTVDSESLHHDNRGPERTESCRSLPLKEKRVFWHSQGGSFVPSLLSVTMQRCGPWLAVAA